MTTALGRVMLIDDNEADNSFHERILRKSGRVGSSVSYTSAARALESLRTDESPPDLILLDLNMPRMNGWQFLEEYSKLEMAVEKRVVVMLTNSGNPRDKARVETSALPHRFITKPLTPELLEELIDLEPAAKDAESPENSTTREMVQKPGSARTR